MAWPFLRAIALSTCSVVVLAQDFYRGPGVVFFSGASAPEGATWSGRLSRGERGLEASAGPNASLEFWFQSGPIPTGPSWRPPRSSMITLSLGGFGAEAAAWPADTRAFFRYSADRVHWSSWYRLAPAPPVTSLVGYVQVRVEGDAHQVHVASMTVWFSSDPGGLESIPRGPRRPTADGPWFFDLAKLGR